MGESGKNDIEKINKILEEVKLTSINMKRDIQNIYKEKTEQKDYQLLLKDLKQMRTHNDKEFRDMHKQRQDNYLLVQREMRNIEKKLETAGSKSTESTSKQHDKIHKMIQKLQNIFDAHDDKIQNIEQNHKNMKEKHDNHAKLHTDTFKQVD